MKKSVTLVELIIVVVVLGILAAVAIPGYQGVVQRSRVSKALNAMDRETSVSVLALGRFR